MKRLITLMVLCVGFQFYSHGAYLRNVPITKTQPDGTKIECFATGDEFYNWLHDTDGYTIVRNNAGYYCYAILDGEDLVASQYIVGAVSPKSVSSLTPHTNLSGEKIREKVNEITRNSLREESTPQRAGTPIILHNHLPLYL